MASFTYSDYKNVVARAQAGSNGTSVKVGFFKLKNDLDSALVRINCSNTDDLDFASVHTISTGGKWMKVSCLNEVGSYNDNCPLCEAVANGDSSIGKAKKQVFVQMMCAYMDPVTNEVSNAIPVIWERPAGFANDLNGKIRDYGSLKDTVFKVTRHGAAGDMKTTYSIDFIPLYNDAKYVPNDFSAFANFDISRHSYWVKTKEEIEEFLSTGLFPEVQRKSQPADKPLPQQAPAAEATPEVKVEAPVYEAPKTEVPKTQTITAKTEERAKPKFGNFSF